ncbi:SMC family ATPase [Arthrobacter stackebrandtii]|nr:SMC family ATPase [Arthrobacter stackebrandtii]
MRIHRLEIQAFGPFAGRETIDFDQLGSQGLFLLNGSTGAGKSSVLDAIAYALYGQVPGSRASSPAQLRSHHAADGVGPEVTIEFTAGGRRLEVRRSPEWMRPRKRGAGTTREQASTQLRERNGAGWEVKSTRNDEAASEIQSLLGMSMAQFTKVVLLAQGDFAAFLRANATDRQALLQKLFGTDIYEGVQERLAADSRLAQDNVAAGLGELAAAEQLARSQSAQVLAAEEQALASAGQGGQDMGSTEPASIETADGAELEAATEAGASEDAVPWGELHGPDLFQSLKEALARAVDRTGSLSAQARDTAASLADSVQEAEKLRRRHLALAAATAEEARLAAMAPEDAGRRARQERHRQAQVLAAVVGNAAKAAKALALAESAAAGAGDGLDANAMASAMLGGESATATVAALEGVDRELTEQLATVAAALPGEAAHRQKTLQLAKDGAALKLALQRQELQGEAADTAKARLSQVQERREEVRAGAGAVDHSAQAVRDAEQTVATIEAHQSHSIRVKELDAAESAAREQALTAKAAWLEAFDLRLSQAAGELAATLVDGEPCQVCGSTVHPAPSPLAGTGADLVKAETAAKKRFEASDAAATAARTVLEEARNKLAILAERGGAGGLQEARDAVVLKKEEHRLATEAAAELARLVAELATLQAEIDAAQQAVVAATGQAASLAAGQAALESELAVLAASLEVARDGHATLEARQNALALARKPVAALLAAKRELAAATSAAADASAALDKELGESDFADAAGVRAALLAPAEAAELDRLVKDYARELAVNADRLAAPEVAAAREEAAAGTAVPGEETVAELVRGAAEARAAEETAALAAGMARNAASQVAQTGEEFLALEEKVGPLRERARLLAGLAEAVRGGGDNKYKMTLSAYVLAARLEQVAEAASLRLGTMSDARYTLRHSDAKKGNQKAGLGLEVVDGWTGLSRDTATLSGGESFMASLSLALGLSDVVQQESGGLDIETLFVDEGFGSLDEESLEQVMDALEGLRDGGRMVGLVSHVAEMKQRIPLHLHVHKGRHGSTVELKMAGAGTP